MIKINEMAKRLGVSIKTLQRWDRFVRFGFDWFKRFCNHYDCEIIVINNPDTSPQKELVDDLISIIHVFSCRIHGLRKYKKDISSDESLQNRNQTN